MSKEVSSESTTGFHISGSPSCEDMEECYPLIDLKRLGIALCGVVVLFVIAFFVL